jgi:hypothetical protein
MCSTGIIHFSSSNAAANLMLNEIGITFGIEQLLSGCSPASNGATT